MPVRAVLSVILMLLLSAPARAADIALAHREDNASADLDAIIEMRSTLAREFVKPGVDITRETFGKVCGQVAKRVKEISESEGITIRHAALKNRNPVNAATPEEEAAIAKFRGSKELKEIREEVVKDGKRLVRLTKPVYVENACLACHGAKDGRPKFIIEKYPEDKAYGFKAGDLRGIVSATIPAE